MIGAVTPIRSKTSPAARPAATTSSMSPGEATSATGGCPETAELVICMMLGRIATSTRMRKSWTTAMRPIFAPFAWATEITAERAPGAAASSESIQDQRAT